MDHVPDHSLPKKRDPPLRGALLDLLGHHGCVDGYPGTPYGAPAAAYDEEMERESKRERERGGERVSVCLVQQKHPYTSASMGKRIQVQSGRNGTTFQELR